MDALRLALAALLSLACGCATKEMKTTPFYEGSESAFRVRAEDRVNVWPLAYWRDPACSVAWPLISFGDDHFAFRPLYSQYRQGGSGAPYDEYNVLWPLGQADLSSGDYTAFPFFWGDGYFAAFPEVLLTDRLTVVLPFAMDSTRTGSSGTLFPLVFWSHERDDRSFTLLPVYSYSRTPERNWLWGACGLFGRYESGTGKYAHWALPIYFANRDSVLSVPWSRFESFDGSDVVDAYRCGLGGRTRHVGLYRSSWAVPLYYHDERRLVTPIFGKSSGSDWIMPLYYRDGHSLFTLAYAEWDNPETDVRGLISPPLLTWASWSTNTCRSSWGALAGLVGATSNATGMHRKSWALPFYWSDAERDFWSLPYGWTGGGTSQTNTWWATPLVGTRSGRETGWWAFPLYDSSEDADYVRLAGLADETALPPDVDLDARCETWGKRDILFSRHFRGVLCGRGFGSESNRYVVVETGRTGNPLLYWQTSERRSSYDAESRAKTSDRESVDAYLLGFLYTYSSERDLVIGTESSRHRVLWKVWDWRRTGEDVRLDAIPGLTYDARSDGYSKTSFLWRFFRWESDPADGTEVDFLFLPVWR